MEYSITNIRNHAVVEFLGDISTYNVSKFKEMLFELIDGDNLSIIIDMKHLNFLDSSGIGVIMAGHKKMQALQGHFALLNVSPEIMQVLVLATLDNFFTIYEDYEELP